MTGNGLPKLEKGIPSNFTGIVTCREMSFNKDGSWLSSHGG